MDDQKTTPPDRPDWGERRRRSEPPRRADPPRRDDEPRPRDEPPPSDPPRPHGDPLFDEQPYGNEQPYGRPPPPRSGLDFSALFVLLDALRRAAPTELQDRVTAFIREGLLTLRSLIDWYLERLERPSREPRVEDIPID